MEKYIILTASSGEQFYVAADPIYVTVDTSATPDRILLTYADVQIGVTGAADMVQGDADGPLTVEQRVTRRLQDLREDVSLERFAQRDPLMEYRRRAVDRFADLEKEICEASITQVCALQPPETRPEIVFPKPARPEVSRNAPCPCGRARKYKRCCSQRLQS